MRNCAVIEAELKEVDSLYRGAQMLLEQANADIIRLLAERRRLLTELGEASRAPPARKRRGGQYSPSQRMLAVLVAEPTHRLHVQDLAERLGMTSTQTSVTAQRTHENNVRFEKDDVVWKLKWPREYGFMEAVIVQQRR